MSPFLWFAIILTVAYIIYYTVMIMNDLYGKKPEEQNNTEEIDVPAPKVDELPLEAPIPVSESNEGFSVGEEQYEANPLLEEEEVIEENSPAQQEEQTPKTSPAENLRNNTEPRSEGTDPQFNDVFTQDDYMNSLVTFDEDEKHKLGGAVIKKELVRDEI